MLINLFAVFNQRDSERRLPAIADNYTDDVIWTDPEGTTHGHEALNDRAPWEHQSSRRRSAATTSRWCAMDGSPCCTRC